MSRRILFLTATRAEYDILAPIASELSKTSEVGLLVAGSHTSSSHGDTLRFIEEDGLPIVAKIDSLEQEEDWVGRAKSFNNLIAKITEVLAKESADILVFAGDREEALAGAIACTFLRIFSAHLHGGDRCIASDIDEVFRPAISKLSVLHFPATEQHKKRLIKMGEQEHLIWAHGAPGLDGLSKIEDISTAELSAHFKVDLENPFFMLIQHPTSTIEPEAGKRQMKEIISAILSYGYPLFCSYPNSDPGNSLIRASIDQVKAMNSNLIAYESLPRAQFAALYRRTAAIFGNSSSIVIESPFLRVPGILIGPRQDLREIADNTLRVGANYEEVHRACGMALNDKDFLEKTKNCKSPYGDGQSASRIAHTLASVDLRNSDLLKTMPY